MKKIFLIILLSLTLSACATGNRLPVPDKKPVVELQIVQNPLKIYPTEFLVINQNGEIMYALSLEQYKIYEQNMEKIQNRLWENTSTIQKLQQLLNL